MNLFVTDMNLINQIQCFFLALANFKGCFQLTVGSHSQCQSGEQNPFFQYILPICSLVFNPWISKEQAPLTVYKPHILSKCKNQH